jgi:hypothetical protein
LVGALDPQQRVAIGLVGKLVLDFSITCVEIFSIAPLIQALSMKKAEKARFFLVGGRKNPNIFLTDEVKSKIFAQTY